MFALGAGNGQSTIMHPAPAASVSLSTAARRSDADDPLIRLRVLSPADYRRMPWKNGAGRTTELASYPPGAVLDAFDWRVSIADVDRDAPFSAFAGVDRIIVLLAGAGMLLGGAGRTTSLLAPYEPHAFSGDDAIECALVDGPVRDFNLMLRRGRATGEVAVVRGGAASIAPARFRLSYAAGGACECTLPGHPPQFIAADHALLVEAEPASGAVLGVKPLTAQAVAIVVRVTV